MSSLRQRLVVRLFNLSYYVPLFGELYRFAWETLNHSRAVDVYLRNLSPRDRREWRKLMKMTGEYEGSFDSRPERPTLH